MKKAFIFLSLAIIISIGLVGCKNPVQSSSQMTSSSNKTETSAVNETNSQSKSSQSQNEEVSTSKSATKGILYYESLEKVEFAVLTATGDGSIDKNGESWLAPPSNYAFGAPVYVDEENNCFYIALYNLGKTDPSQGVFDMWKMTFDLKAVPIHLVCEGKIFTGVEGRILVCSDGTGYNTDNNEWVQLK